MTVQDLMNLLMAQYPDATIVTQPTASSPAPTTHSPCSGRGIISGVRDAACDGTGQVYTKPLVKITIPSSGIVAVSAIPVLT